MRKIYSILIILIACTIISCNDSSGSGSSEGYVNPGFDRKPVSQGWIGITGMTSGSGSKAVMYQGPSQSGIAIDNGTQNLKIYWTGSFGTPPFTPNNCTIKLTTSGPEIPPITCHNVN